MNLTKVTVPTVVVIAVLGASFGFRHAAGIPSVYCAPVEPNNLAPCADFACPTIDLVEFQVTTNSQGISNPCAQDKQPQVPYQTTATTCTQYAAGTEFVAIDE